jgi:hypothetical protein
VETTQQKGKSMKKRIPKASARGTGRHAFMFLGLRFFTNIFFLLGGLHFL